MPTRRQQATTAKGISTNNKRFSDQVQHALPSGRPVEYSAKSIPASTVNAPGNKGTESIGSRLRKRRRTDSSPTDDSPPPPKRSQSRKAIASSGKHQQGASPPQAASSASNTKPKLSQQANPPFVIEPDQDDLLAMQLEEAIASESALPEAATITQPESGEAPQVPDHNGDTAGMSHRGETADSHQDSQTYDVVGTIDTESFHDMGASFHLKTQSLPILDNLATQILNTLAKSTYREILTIATEPDSQSGQAYATLKSLFEHTKKIYSLQEPFLNPYELGLIENAHMTTIKKANMATFVSSVFGSQDVGFYHLNENFLDTFLSDGSRLLKNQAQLFLDLKTQAYISAVNSGDRSREEILEDLFPHDLDERLLKRRPGAKQLTPSEADFVQRARNRRKALLEEPSTDEAVKALPEKYIWEDFLRDISSYVAKNFEAIAGVIVSCDELLLLDECLPLPDKTRKSQWLARAPGYSTTDQKQQLQGQQARGQRRPNHPQSSQQISQTQQDDLVSGMHPPAPPPTLHNDAIVGDTDGFAQKAARAANLAIQDWGNSQGAAISQHPPHGQTPVGAQAPSTPQNPNPSITREIRYHFENELHPNVPAPPPPQYFQEIQFQQPQQLQRQWEGIDQIHQSYSNQQLIPNPAQSAPTQVLYERARQAATTKSSPSNRRSGTPSQRRPWTSDEENSLMAGLDRVKGPHWSQILAMFGPGGTINEVLKDRNQVQLKDKARNLKLFFLKSGIEVPYYLQFVTGELKTRAPGQAAKNEAKEKGTNEEDRAHYEGVIALAGGAVQDSDQPMTGIEGQNETSQSGVVPTANMGSSIIPNRQNGLNTSIDPKINNDGSVNKGAGNATERADAPTEGHGEFMTPASQRGPQQHQLPHGYVGAIQVNGATMNGTPGTATQPASTQLRGAAQRTMASSSSNVDPSLPV